MLTLQVPSGPDLGADLPCDLEQLFLWVSVMKGAVGSDLGVSILSLHFSKCLTHCLATQEALEFCGGAGRMEKGRKRIKERRRKGEGGRNRGRKEEERWRRVGGEMEEALKEEQSQNQA